MFSLWCLWCLEKHWDKLLCSHSPNDAPPELQRNVSIAAVRGAVRPSKTEIRHLILPCMVHLSLFKSNEHIQKKEHRPLFKGSTNQASNRSLHGSFDLSDWVLVRFIHTNAVPVSPVPPPPPPHTHTNPHTCTVNMAWLSRRQNRISLYMPRSVSKILRKNT